MSGEDGTLEEYIVSLAKAGTLALLDSSPQILELQTILKDQ